MIWYQSEWDTCIIFFKGWQLRSNSPFNLFCQVHVFDSVVNDRFLSFFPPLFCCSLGNDVLSGSCSTRLSSGGCNWAFLWHWGDNEKRAGKGQDRTGQKWGEKNKDPDGLVVVQGCMRKQHACKWSLLCYYSFSLFISPFLLLLFSCTLNLHIIVHVFPRHKKKKNVSYSYGYKLAVFRGTGMVHH